MMAKISREMMLLNFNLYLIATGMSLLGMGIFTGMLISEALGVSKLYELVGHGIALSICFVCEVWGIEKLSRYKIIVSRVVADGA